MFKDFKAIYRCNDSIYNWYMGAHLVRGFMKKQSQTTVARQTELDLNTFNPQQKSMWNTEKQIETNHVPSCTIQGVVFEP